MKLLFFALIALFTQQINAFYFFLKTGERKCFYKELAKDTLLQGTYSIQSFDANTNKYIGIDPSQLQLVIDVEEVFDNNHRVVHQMSSPQGEFTFNTLDSGEHKICFQPQSKGWMSNHNVRFDIEFDVGNQDLLDSKKTGTIQNLHAKVLFLNSKLQEIRREQSLVRDREAKFRDLSEATNSKVVNWSIIQLVVLGAACFWQMKHLRTFFVKQKIV